MRNDHFPPTKLRGAISPAARETLTQFVLSPISEIFTRLLNTFVGPMVFLSIMTGICGIGMRHMELVLQAEKLGMLDSDVLRRP